MPHYCTFLPNKYFLVLFTAHKANVHGQTSKQARTIEFQFNLAPRGRANQENGVTGSYSTETPAATTTTSHQTPKIIDARNEQEFPSLGNVPINIRPTVTLNMRPSTSGLARTKENFPALGGGSSHNREPFKPPNAAPSVSASKLLFKTPAKVATNSNATNKTNANKAKTVPIKSHDFPALPGSSSSGKSQRANLESDMIETPLSFNPAVISSKHRALVQSFETVGAANSSSNQKIKTIQQNETKPQHAIHDHVPSIKSKENFPALGGGASSAAPPQWLNGTNGTKKQPQISKKLKVAPAPLLTTNKTNENNKKDDDSNKKSNDKSKDKKKEAIKTDNSNGKKGEKDKTKKSDDNAKKTKENNEKNANKNEKKTIELNSGAKSEQNGSTSNGIINSYSSVAHFTMPPPGFPAKKTEKGPKIPPGFENLSTKDSTASTYNYMSPSNALQRNQVRVCSARTCLFE